MPSLSWWRLNLPARLPGRRLPREEQIPPFGRNSGSQGVLEVRLTARQGQATLDTVAKPVQNFLLFDYEVIRGTASDGQKSGGNLSEALGNLSKVLRERKKMKAKIQAMSQEAKASAGIIGSLPIVVMLLVYLTSPQYIELLWTHPTGRMLLAVSAFWMSMGIMVMRKMINFDF